MIFNNFYNLFLKVCKSTRYMDMMIMPSTKIRRGITSLSPQPNKMFFNNLEIKIEFKSDNLNTIEIYKSYIDDLLNKTREEEDIIFYFRDALKNSNIIETAKFEDKEIELNICQKYFITQLKKEISIEEKRAILFLISKAGEWKTNGVYILVETYPYNFKNLNYEYLVYFGEIVTEDIPSVFNILVNNLRNTNDFNIVYYVLLSLLTIDTQIGSFMILNSRKSATESKYSKIIKKEILRMDSFFQLIVSLLLTSEMNFTSKFSIYREPYQKIYLDFFKKTFLKALKQLKFSDRFELKKRLSPKDIKELKADYNTNYLTKIFIKLAEHSNSENNKFLYSIMVNSLKLNFDFLPFIEHYAYANYKIGDIDKAVEVYESLVQNNPDVLGYRLEILNYYFEQKNFQALEQNIEYIELVYKLSDEEEQKINQIRESVQSCQTLNR